MPRKLCARSALALAAALSAAALPLSSVAATDTDALIAQVKALAERVERLEAQNIQLRTALESDRISDTEPELATRLKAVEAQQQAMKGPAGKLAEAFDGISVEGSLTGMVQHASRNALADPTSGRSRANYRGDLAVTLPGGDFGVSKGTVFVHARFGQGEGLGLRPTYTGTANSTTFSGTDPDDTQFTLAQAWYQLDMPLGEGDANKATFTLGKIDPFGFFDQNAIADDETRHFSNNVFVHNPLLDSGGDIGADRFGFSPGAIAAYENTSDKAMPWGASLGVFGSGNGANFSGSSGRPFVIAQAWVSPRINQLPGTYRAYAWSNARGADFDGGEARHGGIGVSLDQRVSDDLTLFARYGHQTSGRVLFDNALTLGAELDGSAWRRGSDGLGVAFGVLRTSGRYASASAADPAGYGYAARGSERIGELFYRLHLNDHVEITPSLQVISRPAANADAKRIAVLGLRARVGF
ncbi:carbohydrate porin [Simplicispira suum]|uniref:Transporter n=1 Tax=Simplicispira suum TaxID=2109915 RepID=A0A2S0MYP9_9BURK|nr:carbohydrate porin [Simplicispira suum]AVO41032.1 transporter [Simplicispira suum]